LGAKKGKEEPERGEEIKEKAKREGGAGGGGEGKVEGKFTHPSEPTVKPTGFSTLANTPRFSPKRRKKALEMHKKEIEFCSQKAYFFCLRLEQNIQLLHSLNFQHLKWLLS